MTSITYNHVYNYNPILSIISPLAGRTKFFLGKCCISKLRLDMFVIIQIITWVKSYQVIEGYQWTHRFEYFPFLSLCMG
jgi:hypothetical protein